MKIMNTRDDIPELIRDLIYGQDHRLFEDDVGKIATHLIQLGIKEIINY